MVFHIKNYTEGDREIFPQLPEGCLYLVFGKELGQNETPHLQVFFIFKTTKHLAAVKSIDGIRALFEVDEGTSDQATDQCEKDADYTGALPISKPRRNDLQ